MMPRRLFPRDENSTIKTIISIKRCIGPMTLFSSALILVIACLAQIVLV